MYLKKPSYREPTIYTQTHTLTLICLFYDCELKTSSSFSVTSLVQTSWLCHMPSWPISHYILNMWTVSVWGRATCPVCLSLHLSVTGVCRLLLTCESEQPVEVRERWNVKQTLCPCLCLHQPCICVCVCVTAGIGCKFSVCVHILQHVCFSSLLRVCALFP